MAHRLCRFRLVALFPLLGSWLGPGPVGAQLPQSVSVNLPGGTDSTLPVEDDRGYPAIPAGSLTPLGWTVAGDRVGGEVVLRHRTGLELLFWPGSPFVFWDEALIQMVDSPYWSAGTLYLPLQLAVDLFPGFLPDAYAFDEERYLLLAEGAEPTDWPAPSSPSTSAPRPEATGPPASGPAPPTWSPRDGERATTVVIIDPGHGGDDPGAIGPGGVAEKDVALSVGLALARELSKNPAIEVRLTRDRDVEVPIWTRGEWATEWKGDRRGAFVSIHVNALPERAGVRGFETYFLSEARTEHERRVAAVENAALAQAPDLTPAGSDPLLGGILSDLRAFDHQQWSALLAEEVQRELSEFHPGTDRGVKQGPFAVVTNTLMPAVLVEMGFITNPEEERLLSRDEFHRDAALAISRALERFLERYPRGGAP